MREGEREREENIEAGYREVGGGAAPSLLMPETSQVVC